MTFTQAGRRASCFLLLVFMFTSIGCGDASSDANSTSAPARSSAGGSGPRLVFVSNGNADWWNAVEKGMLDGAKDFGAEVELRRNNSSDTAGQMKLLEDVLSLPDVRGVAVSVMEAESPGIADKMRELQNAGKVVIAIDSDGPKDARKAYIGSNNVKAGEVAGKVAKGLRPQGGKTVVFVGTAAAANARERRDGFFAGAGDWFRMSRQRDALEVMEDGADPSRAQINVQTAVSKYPDAGVFLGLWSYNGPRIAEEVAKFPDVRKKLTIVTFDMDEQNVDHLEKGDIDATVCQNPYQMGYLGVRLLKAYIENDRKTIDEMLPGGTDSIDTGVRVIVPTKDSPVKGENVIDIREMKAWLDSKGLKSS